MYEITNPQNPAGYFGKPFSMQQQVVSIKSRAAFQNEKNGNLVQKFCLYAKQGVKNMALLICEPWYEFH